MRRIIIIVLICIASSILLISCTDNTPLQQQQQSTSKQTPSQQPTTSNQIAKTEKSVEIHEPAQTKSKIWPFTDKEQEINLAQDLIAKNYVLIFDGSGSMNDSGCSAGRKKIQVAKKAVVEWVRTIPEDANLGLAAFHENTWSVLDLATGSDHGAKFIQRINSIIADGGTPLSEAMIRAYKNLTMQGMRQLGYGEYTIVVVTDGVANDQVKLSNSIDSILMNSPINIYTIGFCIGTNHSLNQPGKTLYKAANNPEMLRKGLKEVLAESDTFDDSDFTN